MNKINLNENEVHIYYVMINSAKQFIPFLKKYLSNEEKLKVMKYIFEKDRAIQMISRSVLKNILSRYLSDKTEDVIFSYNQFGKPFISENKNPDSIRFNLSHSGNMILYAVSRKRNVGIDVQEINKTVSVTDIIEHYFSDHEIAQFKSLPEELMLKAFYSCWTRKEAYIKARGKGLSFPLNSFSVPVFPGLCSKLLHDDEGTGWSLTDIISSPEYTAAIAAEGNNLTYHFFKWAFDDMNGSPLNPYEGEAPGE